jgi:hypothetical protein
MQYTATCLKWNVLYYILRVSGLRHKRATRSTYLTLLFYSLLVLWDQHPLKRLSLCNTAGCSIAFSCSYLNMFSSSLSLLMAVPLDFLYMTGVHTVKRRHYSYFEKVNKHFLFSILHFLFQLSYQNSLEICLKCALQTNAVYLIFICPCIVI